MPSSLVLALSLLHHDIERQVNINLRELNRDQDKKEERDKMVVVAGYDGGIEALSEGDKTLPI